VYRKIWDSRWTKQYFNYPFPAWYYGAVAGSQKLLTGRESVLHELQMEPWPAYDKPITETPLVELDKSFPAAEFKARVAFAKNTGLKSIDLWGAEYWYYRKQIKNDPEFWDAATSVFRSE
jgi:hypothetical protein